MVNAVSLFEFLERSSAGVTAYDVGRRIGAIDRATFVGFEHALLAYPLPMQRKAWFALVQRPTTESEPLIWFLRLDLDEQGLLVQAARDYLLERLLESARARHQGADAQGFLRDNPFAFTPRDDRMALFHARLSADLGLPPSRFHAHAADYFAGRLGWDQWEFVGYQGIADVACRDDQGALADAIAPLPREPLVALCHCLESRAPDGALAVALVARLQRALAETPRDATLLAALVRGLSAGTNAPDVHAALAALLAHPATAAIEVLAAISGRAWEALLDPALLHTYLQRLAENDHGQAAFEHCVSDLLSVPALTTAVRDALRAPHLAAGARAAVARMIEARGGKG